MASMFTKLSPGGRALLIGVPAASAMYWAFWAGLREHHKHKWRRDPDHPGSVPTWEYRMSEAAANPVENADKPATLRSQVFERSPPSQDETRYQSPIGAPKGPTSYPDTFVSDAEYPAGQKDQAARKI